MSLKDQITEDMKTAMRAKDAARLLTIRGLLAALKQKEVDERITLDDAAVIGVIDKLVKQRKDSISQFAAAGRTDPHRVIVFIKGRIDPNRDHARRMIARALLDESVAAQLAPLERDAEIAGLRAIGDPTAIAAEIPDDLLDRLTATGTPESVLASLTAIAEAGVDAIAFAPIGPNPDEQLRLLADTIAPAFRA